MGLRIRLLSVLAFIILLLTAPILVSAGEKVSFDPSVLKSKANTIKEKIRISKNNSIDIIRRGEYIRAQNSRLDPSNDLQHMPENFVKFKEREQFRYQNKSCHNTYLFKELKENFQTNCAYVDLYDQCQKVQESSRIEFESISRQLASTPSTWDGGIKSTLVAHKTRLEQVFRSLVRYNNSCSESAKNTIFGPKCLRTFEQVFDTKLNQFLADTCDEEIIDEMVSGFTEYMERNVVYTLDLVVAGHVSSRELEGKIVETILNIRKSINALEGRVPSNESASLDF